MDQHPHHLVSFEWLVRLRWLVGVAHLLLLVATVALGSPELWIPAGIALVVGAGSNVALVRWSDPAPSATMAWVIALDVVLLTVLLAASGGASNPFTFLYLFQLVIAAMVLEPRWVWPLVALEAAAYGALFWLAPQEAAHHHGGESMQTHLVGMWVAFAVAGPFAAVAVTRIRAGLIEADAQLAEARRLEERTTRLTALGTLAAGAAHELATPLSTIAIVANELMHQHDGEVAEDAKLVCEQVKRCREVLNQLSARSGQGMGESRREVRVGQFVAETVEAMRDERVRTEVPAELADDRVWLPVDLASQAVRRLVQNALDASTDHQSVVVEVRSSHPLDLWVRDDGAGMSAEVLAQATDPFFTTKETGAGMGLGLHFARSVAEQLGGTLELHSEPGKGTVAHLELPSEES